MVDEEFIGSEGNGKRAACFLALVGGFQRIPKCCSNDRNLTKFDSLLITVGVFDCMHTKLIVVQKHTAGKVVEQVCGCRSPVSVAA